MTSAATMRSIAARRWSFTTMPPLLAQTVPSMNRISVGSWSTSSNVTAGLWRRCISATRCATTKNICLSTKVLPASNA